MQKENNDNLEFSSQNIFQKMKMEKKNPDIFKQKIQTERICHDPY